MSDTPTPFDALGGEAFVRALVDRFYDLMDLEAGYAGIRPKISGPHEAAADFMLQGPQQHGVPGLVNLLGIESPGLTSSLAIADEVLSLLKDTANA